MIVSLLLYLLVIRSMALSPRQDMLTVDPMNLGKVMIKGMVMIKVMVMMKAMVSIKVMVMIKVMAMIKVMVMIKVMGMIKGMVMIKVMVTTQVMGMIKVMIHNQDNGHDQVHGHYSHCQGLVMVLVKIIIHGLWSCALLNHGHDRIFIIKCMVVIMADTNVLYVECFTWCITIV